MTQNALQGRLGGRPRFGDGTIGERMGVASTVVMSGECLRFVARVIIIAP